MRSEKSGRNKKKKRNHVVSKGPTFRKTFREQNNSRRLTLSPASPSCVRAITTVMTCTMRSSTCDSVHRAVIIIVRERQDGERFAAERFLEKRHCRRVLQRVVRGGAPSTGTRTRGVSVDRATRALSSRVYLQERGSDTAVFRPGVRARRLRRPPEAPKCVFNEGANFT